MTLWSFYLICLKILIFGTKTSVWFFVQFYFVFDPLTEKYFIRLHGAFAMHSLVLSLYSCKKKIKLNIKKTLNDNILSDFIFEIFNRIFFSPEVDIKLNATTIFKSVKINKIPSSIMWYRDTVTYLFPIKY